MSLKPGLLESSSSCLESKNDLANFSARMRDSEVGDGLLRIDFSSISSLWEYHINTI